MAHSRPRFAMTSPYPGRSGPSGRSEEHNPAVFMRILPSEAARSAIGPVTVCPRALGLIACGVRLSPVFTHEILRSRPGWMRGEC